MSLEEIRLKFQVMFCQSSIYTSATVFWSIQAHYIKA